MELSPLYPVEAPASPSRAAPSPPTTAPEAPISLAKEERPIDPEGFVDLLIQPDGDNRIKLYGRSAMFISRHLRELGSFRRKRGDEPPHWSFDALRRKDVESLIAEAQAGRVEPEDPLKNRPPRKERERRKRGGKRAAKAGFVLPTLGASSSSSTQTVTYTVPRPRKGGVLRLVQGQESAEYTAVEVLSSNGDGVLDTIHIAPKGKGGPLSLVCIVNGKWQVFGYTVEHKVVFQ